MFRLFVVAVFLFSFASLVANAAEFEMEPIVPSYEEEPMETEPMIEPRPEIDPGPLWHTPEGEEGDVPVPLPRPVDEHGIEDDPTPFDNTPEPAGEGRDIEIDPEPMV